jgi:hypothetical protein
MKGTQFTISTLLILTLLLSALGGIATAAPTAPELASIGDLVWEDINQDGIQDAGEPGVPGVTVTLYDGASNIVATSTTDASGLYSFMDLTEGDYYLGFMPPYGYYITLQDQGADDTVDSDANPTTGLTILTTLDPDENDPTWDAGMSQIGNITAHKFEDLNGNGVQDVGEPDLSGWTMILHAGSGCDPFVILGTGLTDGSGNVNFANLTDGDYSVSEALLPGWSNTTALCQDVTLAGGGSEIVNFGNQQLQPLELDYGDAPDSYGTLLASDGARHPGGDVAAFSLGPIIDLEPDGQPSAQADGDDLNPIDLPDDEDGVTLPVFLTAGTSAGAQVHGGPLTGLLDAWIDFDANGVFDHPGEHLFGGTSTSIPPGVDTPISFQVPATAVPGPTYARFRLSSDGGLMPTGLAGDGEVEDYLVEIQQLPHDYGDAPDSYGTLDASNGARHAAIPEVAFSLGPVVDLELDGQPSALADGDDLNPPGAPDDEDGVVLPATLTAGAAASADVTLNSPQITGMIDAWIDFDGNGVFAHPGEHLTGGTSTSIPPNSTIPINFTVPATAVPGMTYARFRLSTDGGLTPTGLSGDGEVEDYTVTILQLLDLGDYVWYDTDQDGIQDTGEPGVPDIVVDLYLRDCTTGQFVATDTTDANGNYLFQDLSSGIYCLEFSNIPAGWFITLPDQGADDSVDSDADPLTAQITDINLTAADLDEDMGLYAEGSIGDTVFCDANGNGAYDPGEGVAGVTVSLSDDPGCDGLPINLLATQDTVGDGQYLFTGVPVGPPGGNPNLCYYVEVDEAGMGTCDVPITPTGYAVPLNADAPDDLDNDFGFEQPISRLGDRVWYDDDQDGIQDGGESGVAGVTVMLYECAGETQIDSTTTDANGLYHFDGVLPGDYYLAFAPPPDHLFSPQNQGTDEALDSDPDEVTGETVCFSFDATEYDLNWDAGVYEPPPPPPPVIPEASTLLLMGGALSGLAGYAGLQLRARRRK